MAMSFEKLQSLAGSGSQGGLVSNLFSSHPDTAVRIERMCAHAAKEDYKQP